MYHELGLQKQQEVESSMESCTSIPMASAPKPEMQAAVEAPSAATVKLSVSGVPETGSWGVPRVTSQPGFQAWPGFGAEADGQGMLFPLQWKYYQ